MVTEVTEIVVYHASVITSQNQDEIKSKVISQTQ